MPCAVESPTATHNGPSACRARSFDSSQYCRYSLPRPRVAATPGRTVRISRPVRNPIARILPAVGGDPALRAELKTMADRDTDAGGPTDESHGARLWEILDDYECWPGRRLVDDDGAAAPWILPQPPLFAPRLHRPSPPLLEIPVPAAAPP